MKFGIKLILCICLMLPITLVVFQSNAIAQEDPLEEDMTDDADDDSDVSVDTDTAEADDKGSPSATDKDEDDEDKEKPLKPSPDANTFLHFTKPLNSDFVAGFPVRVLLGFTNKASKDFVLDTMDASFRYPQDYTYFIHNFTVIGYNRVVEPQKQATLEYGFLPSESFGGRPFGLTILLNYHDADGVLFQEALFNETITLREPDEGLDGETFFLYVFLAAIVVLVVLGAQHLLSSFGKKKSSKPYKAPVEMGTQNASDVDLEWLPKELINELNKSPGSRQAKLSPKQRRTTKRNAGSED